MEQLVVELGGMVESRCVGGKAGMWVSDSAPGV